MAPGSEVERLFIALPCPLTALISNALHELRAAQDAASSGLRGVNPDTLHITLKFLGSVPSDQVTLVKAAMEVALQTDPAITLELRGAGSFPGALWLGVVANSAVADMARRCDVAMETLGFPPERRPFRPHITVARLKPNATFDSTAWVQQQRDIRWGELRADTVHLYRSETRPGGALYTVIHSVPLRGAFSGSEKS